MPFDDYEKRDPEAFRRLFKEGKFAVFAEISTQYNGLSPADGSLEPYSALAEELDIPVGIHMGEGPPGAPAPPSFLSFPVPGRRRLRLGIKLYWSLAVKRSSPLAAPNQGRRWIRPPHNSSNPFV